MNAATTSPSPSNPCEGDRHTCGTTYDGLAADVTAGERILVDDGRVTLEVTEVDGPRVHTTVIEGGMVSDHKGLNLPGVAVSVPALSEKDIDDLRWALRTGADVIALSFVRTGRDIDDVHRIMDEEDRRLPVIAKVEKPQAVDNIDDIVAAFDGIMVARGDLGVEMPLEQVPIVQKRAIKLAKRNAKPVIVATQMLDSMIDNSRPTRAEASDVANAVIDGTDAVMLSGETSVGKYPVETVRTMARIVEAAEEDILAKGLPPLTDRNKPRTQGGAVARAAAEMGDFLGAKFLVAFTQSGDTVKRLSRYRSPIPLLAFTPDHGHPRPAEPDVGRRDVPRAARGVDGRDGGAGGRGAAADRPLPEGRHRGHHGRVPAGGRGLDEPGTGAPHRRGRQPGVTVVSTSARRERP